MSRRTPVGPNIGDLARDPPGYEGLPEAILRRNLTDVHLDKEHVALDREGFAADLRRELQAAYEAGVEKQARESAERQLEEGEADG